MARVMSLLAAIVVVILSGTAERAWTGHTGGRSGPGLTTELARIPVTIGDWRGRSEAMDPREVAAAGLDGYLMRRYEDGRTRSEVGLFIACGRPGPVSVHSPEACYLGSGYRMEEPGPTEVDLRPGDRRGQAVFLRADFVRESSLPPDRLRIYWAWGDGGSWSVPENPRLEFAGRPILYKLYVVHRMTGPPGRAADDPGLEFLRRFVPAANLGN
jgi:hypothetical protein